MSSSSSPIELAILSVKPQDSHVQHAASHVYAVVIKKKKFSFFFILSFNLVKVQDCWMLKFKEILWYISWLSSGGQTERERERKREEESTLLWLSSLARVRLHLRCFGFFFFLSFQGGGGILGVFFSKFRSSPSKSKVFLKIKSHKSSFFI